MKIARAWKNTDIARMARLGRARIRIILNFSLQRFYRGNLGRKNGFMRYEIVRQPMKIVRAVDQSLGDEMHDLSGLL